MNIVLDACAMIAFLRNELGAEIIENFLIDENNCCVAHAINLYEVYYDFLKAENDEDIAKSAIADLRDIGLVPVEDISQDFYQQAGKYKASNKMSLADSFAIALANKLNAELLTSDHHEFEPIAKQGICKINFFREKTNKKN